jgi:hypothetical protein
MFEVTAATPAEIAERRHDAGRLFDAADRLNDARASVRERLLAGKKVGRFTLDAAFEVAVGEEMKEREILGVLTELVAAETPLALMDVQARAQKLVDALLDSMDDEIQAESVRIQQDEAADAEDGLS